MKALITGADGLLGLWVTRVGRQREHEIEEWVEKDLATVSAEQLGSQEVIIHCAAMTDSDYCEKHPQEAWRANAWLPQALAETAKLKGVERFIHLSTEGVYQGCKPGKQREDQTLHPFSVYASTKLEGEGRVLSVFPEALVLRASMVGWTQTGRRPKLAEQILGALSHREEMALPARVQFSPLHAGTLAEIIWDLVEETDASGVLNVGARVPISQFSFGKNVAEVFGYNSRWIVSEEATVYNLGLDVKRLTDLWGLPPIVQRGIERLYEEAFNGTAERIRDRKTYP